MPNPYTSLLDQSGFLRLLPNKGLRVIAEHNCVIHCHHYNSRLQRTIENCRFVDGKAIIKDAARRAHYDQFIKASPDGAKQKRLLDAAALYSYLGLGRMDFARLDSGIVTADSSHYVEGWQCAFLHRDGPICTVAEGYLEAVLTAVSGKAISVIETECMYQGHPRCLFRVTDNAAPPDLSSKRRPLPSPGHQSQSLPQSDFRNIDRNKIVDALFNMPIYGNETGLIPAFNVYLANTPQDYYNLAVTRFIKGMTDAGHRDLAISLLQEDAEHCAMNTFAGIMNSVEWEGLVAPMVRDNSDNLYGIIAVANALGWGQMQVESHVPGNNLVIVTNNYYEAIGDREFLDSTEHEGCPVLTGVAAGIMALVYGAGEFCDRYGLYHAIENLCMSKGDDYCRVVATLAT